MQSNKPKYKLLYVEDEAPIRLVTNMFLKSYFKEIIEANNGAEALVKFKEHQPDIIITDIEMPNINGLEFCKKIREENQTVPIIITTAHINVEYLLEAVSLNLIKYLGKPLQKEELLQALNNCFNQLETANPNIIQITKELYYDMFNQSLSTRTNIIQISTSESMLLNILIKNQHRIVLYEEIENHIWTNKYMTIDSLRSLIRKVRKVVGKEVIENISKSGYKIHLYG